MDWRWAAAGGAGHIVSPRAQLVNLASKMCYPMQNNISWLFHCKIHYKDVVAL